MKDEYISKISLKQLREIEEENSEMKNASFREIVCHILKISDEPENFLKISSSKNKSFWKIHHKNKNISS